MRYFEDFRIGDIFEAGPYVLRREELIDFARRYDPQPFHLDDAAGAATHFGGLVASGWNTAAIAHRLACDLLLDSASLGSPGVEQLRWLRPVRPGDALTLRMEVTRVKPSETKPRGTVTWDFALNNQKGETVMAYRASALFSRRNG